MTSRALPPSLVQVAGIASLAEGRMLGAAGVDWLGWPLRLPVNAEDVSEDEAARLIAALPPAGRHVLITYEGTARGIDRFCRALGVWRVQLHGDIAIDELAALRRLRPDLFIVKSLVVGREDPSELFALAATCSRWVDAFITDTFDPETGAEGATGHVHDWEISRRLVAATPRPVILAGGLRPDNVAAAIRAVRPAGVDVHTGVEDAAGRKDAALVARFVAEARAAFQALAKEEPHACP